MIHVIPRQFGQKPIQKVSEVKLDVFNIMFEMKRYYYRLQAGTDLEDHRIFQSFVHILNKLKPNSLRFEYKDEVLSNVRSYGKTEIMWLLTDVDVEEIKVSLDDLVKRTFLSSWSLAEVAYG